MKNFKEFQSSIGVTFKDERLLARALTHRSYINENKHLQLKHNERLEFLGDAVLELVTTEFLFDKYPDKTEGDLTSYRAAMVNTTMLSTVASDLGINEYLLLSKGEAKDTGRARQYILANTFEALLGALYLDQGYERARAFVAKYLFPLADDIVAHRLWQDAKSHFQEIAQEKSGITPTYQTLDEVGPDHDRHFTVGVFIGERKIAEGGGKSKQEAEQDAAQNALEETGWK
ncbi:ribonuclease III [Candidatus Wolfebacteria bacterium]|nr:ribonuclease III [Candidatus Wolfebacteria bacterium]